MGLRAVALVPMVRKGFLFEVAELDAYSTALSPGNLVLADLLHAAPCRPALETTVTLMRRAYSIAAVAAVVAPPSSDGR